MKRRNSNRNSLEREREHTYSQRSWSSFSMRCRPSLTLEIHRSKSMAMLISSQRDLNLKKKNWERARSVLSVCEDGIRGREKRGIRVFSLFFLGLVRVTRPFVLRTKIENKRISPALKREFTYIFKDIYLCFLNVDKLSIFMIYINIDIF